MATSLCFFLVKSRDQAGKFHKARVSYHGTRHALSQFQVTRKSMSTTAVTPSYRLRLAIVCFFILHEI